MQERCSKCILIKKNQMKIEQRRAITFMQILDMEICAGAALQ